MRSVLAVSVLPQPSVCVFNPCRGCRCRSCRVEAVCISTKSVHNTEHKQLSLDNKTSQPLKSDITAQLRDAPLIRSHWGFLAAKSVSAHHGPVVPLYALRATL